MPELKQKKSGSNLALLFGTFVLINIVTGKQARAAGITEGKKPGYS